MRVDDSLLHRLFYPQVPAVLSAEFGGRVSAMPVVSYASVSKSPPMVVVSCDPSSFTYKLLSKSAKFSLCLLGREHVGALALLATSSGSGSKDKLKRAGLNHSRGTNLDVPVIEGAAATIECELKRREKVGDHVLVFGLVRTSHASRAFSDFWDYRRYKPILYTGWREGLSTYPGD